MKNPSTSNLGAAGDGLGLIVQVCTNTEACTRAECSGYAMRLRFRTSFFFLRENNIVIRSLEGAHEVGQAGRILIISRRRIGLVLIHSSKRPPTNA